MRHPWHPAIVHFPIACWMLATGVDLLDTIFTLPQLPGIDPAALCGALLWAGNAFALPAVITGLIDYAGLPPAIQDGSSLKRHMTVMGSAWMLFLAAAMTAGSRWALAAEVAGVVCLVAGGLAAARVVFEELPAVRANAKASRAKRSAHST